MAVSPIEIGNLLKYITEKKDIKSNLNIDQTCTIDAGDPKPLIKIFNYLINYLNQINEGVIDISLKEQSEGCLLCLIISTSSNQLPPMSDKLQNALEIYNAAMRIVFEEGKYAQILINFCDGHVPDQVIVEV
jgi:hypothetical protein